MGGHEQDFPANGLSLSMILIQAVQKLQNTSRIKAPWYVSAATPGQVLHTWYARLVNTSYPNKMLVMYMHDPSGLTVLVHGKTLQATHMFFLERLYLLLQRLGFSAAFIEREMRLAEEGYVVGKTDSKSMLSRMNQINYDIEIHCQRAGSYEAIPLAWIEEQIAGYIYQEKKSKEFRQVLDYFKDLGVI